MLLALGLVLPATAQDVRTATLTDRAALPQVLNFEDQKEIGPPTGWMATPEGTVFNDNKVTHGGNWAARLERKEDSSGSFSSLHRAIALDFAGKTLELRGFLRTNDVSVMAGLWMREDGEQPALAFDNMANRPVKGTTEWTEYSVRLPIHAEARKVFFGVLLVGSGTAWADDLQLLVDGKPVTEAPKVERPKTVFELDDEFNAGSRIQIEKLSPVQIENLATLGQVWGFLKYHHPKVLSGALHWDYQLLRILPTILQAPGRATANAAMLKWTTGLGPLPPCQPCAAVTAGDVAMRPDVAWLENTKLLGAELSRSLLAIYKSRPAKVQQFYLDIAPPILNPTFKHELSYGQVKFPDAGFQLLALYRFWNIIEYWSPYRDVMGENWDKVLAEFIPRIALAKTKDDYTLQMMALIGRAHDSHANLWSSLDVRPPVGACQFPVIVRFVENQPVVYDYITTTGGKESGLGRGDVITEIDGVPVKKLVDDWKPYYGGSNDASIMRDIAMFMTRGKCGEASAGILRDGKTLALKPTRVPIPQGSIGFTHDLPGETFRLLSKDVAYLKLSTVKSEEATQYVQKAAGTKALIIDIRNYPSAFMVFALGQQLVEKKTDFVRFTTGDVSNPGAFYWSEPLSLTPEQPLYTGRVAILVDESSISQSEYTTMAFRSSPRAIVVGSTTAGADGNTSPFALPGGLQTVISGIGVFYPDKKPTQRIDIIPDVKVEPTIAGIRAGRDEVLEEALRQLLGKSVPEDEIQKMAKPSAGN
ncbi:MAG TPA: S41 family peptidase [Candidatus Angelobacter sp.]|nr:S41 family peptidase [Candidatus Angelobacter sp.]